VIATLPLRPPRLALSVVLGWLAVTGGMALMAVSGWLISKAALQPPILDLAVAIVAVRFFGIARGVFRYLERLASHDLALRVLADIRVALYRALEPLAPAALGKLGSGDLLRRLVGDVDDLQDLLVRGLAPPLVAALVLGLAAGAIWAVAPPAVPALVVPFVVAAAGLSWVNARMGARWAPAQAAARASLSGQVVELVRGLGDIVAFGREAQRLGALHATDRKLAAVDTRRAWLEAVGEGGMVALAGLAGWAVLAAILPVAAEGRLDGTLIAALVLLALASFEAVQPLPAAFERMQQSLASAARLDLVMSTPAPVADPPAPRAPAPGGLRVQGAWLRYRDDGPWVLAGAELELGVGERVALTGASGAGKTSLAHAILRFQELDRGSISLDGLDLRECAQDEVRRLVGLCAEDAHIFNASLLDNLLLARPEATPAELEQALGRARLLDWVSGLPEGLGTRLGEQGALVSAGQRQRVALARALLADFPVLILDEPTANLDEATSRAFLHDFLSERRGRTLLLITHRRQGLEAMDRVLTLEQGRIQSFADLPTRTDGPVT
jgi:thiol reductant ABC exporter CydC subunit